MSFRDVFGRQATKDEKALDELSDSLVEAAFRRNLLTRFVRTVLVCFVTFMATTAFVQSAERKRCENGKVFLKSYTSFVENAAAARRKDAADADTPRERQNNIETAEAYEEQVKLLKPGIKQDCNELYPIVPFLGV